MPIQSSLLAQSPLSWHAPIWARLYKLAQLQKLPQAIFLNGIAQSGKTHFATAFAKLVLCEAPKLIANTQLYQNCQQCHACHLFEAHTHPNYHYITVGDKDAKKQVITIETIRALTTMLQKTRGSLQTVSSNSHYHTVVIIDPVEALHIAASNALLKTLEEPMPGIIFMLLSAKADLVPATIKSRCHLTILPLPSFEKGYAWMLHELKRSKAVVEISDLKMGLQITDNNPLHALALLKTKRIENSYQVIYKAFLKLSDPLTNPSDIAQIWLKQPVEIVLDSLMQITTWLIQAKLGDTHQLEHLKISGPHLTLLLEQQTVMTLLNFLDKIKIIRAESRLFHLNMLLAFEKLAYDFIAFK